MKRPILWALIGPNGAGKSTYQAKRLKPGRLGLEFVNADVLATQHWPGEESRHGYEASKLAARRREQLMADRVSFITETVCSHPSKVELLQDARAMDYRVWVTFIYLATEDLAVARTADRVRQGGHHVPEDKVRARYRRMPEHAVQAVRLADRAFVVDNSDFDRPHRTILIFEHGRVVDRHKPYPAWVKRFFADDL